ncbi:isochorismate synthase [Pseudomonas entomophila]|uniref:isochorismate synthase n=1 Tax=Pseudomonas entomophila TaxID=312306 RepID=UPI0015E3EB10|nr:isochorismate synthase [Pseudomonas entomophila]MBA1189467.1 isochorismate synthase [Pseudomonas entomophila]
MMPIDDQGWRAWRRVLVQARQRAALRGQPVLASLALPTSRIDAFACVARAEASTLAYALLDTRAPDRLLFGVGCAAELRERPETALGAMAEQWQHWLEDRVQEGEVGPLLMGGARFDPLSRRAPHWEDFPAAVMTLHAVQWSCQAEGAWLLLQARVAQGSDIERVIDERRAILACLSAPAPAPAASSSALLALDADCDSIPRRAWEAMAGDAVRCIRAGEMRKVVLARHVQRTHTAPVDVASVLRRLRTRDTDAHVFAVRRGGSCFLGATPERLAHLEQGRVHTHALAGTAARGGDAQVDRQLGQTLMNSPKEREEHDLVVRTIADGLARLGGQAMAADCPQLRKLATLQHLTTPLWADVGEHIGVLDVVEQLHPTPAVAGLALAQALSFIREHEGLDRGWYAGPVGWMDTRAQGDFVVALRSMLVRAHDTYLFAGCGVVADSDPKAEFQETQLKLSGMFKALQSLPHPMPHATPA